MLKVRNITQGLKEKGDRVGPKETKLKCIKKTKYKSFEDYFLDGEGNVMKGEGHVEEAQVHNWGLGVRQGIHTRGRNQLYGILFHSLFGPFSPSLSGP